MLRSGVSDAIGGGDRCVAVVVVHGIANQVPFSNARHVADLLAHCGGGDGSPLYRPFLESGLRIPVPPLELDPLPGEAPPGKDRERQLPGWLKLDERGAYVRAQHERKKERERERLAARHAQPIDASSRRDADRAWSSEGVDAKLDPSYGFMRDQLPAPRGPARKDGDGRARSFADEAPDDTALARATYSTVVLRSERQETPAREVDVYEMYWADLSQPGSGLFQVLVSLYQLILHVSSLGRKTVDLARAAPETEGRAWDTFQWLETWATRILTLPIPALNLYLLAAVLVVFAGHVPEAWCGLVGALLAAVIAGGTTAFWVVATRERGLWWWLAPSLAAVIGGGLGYALCQTFGGYQFESIAVTLWVALWLLVGLVLRRYDRVRPGAGFWGGIVLGAVAFLVFIGVLYLSQSLPVGDAPIPQSDLPAEALAYLRAQPLLDRATWVGLGTFGLLFLLLLFCWLIFTSFQLLAAIAGWIAGHLRNVRDLAALRRARRVRRTAWITLAVPQALFIILSVSLWLVAMQVLPTYMARFSTEPNAVWHPYELLWQRTIHGEPLSPTAFFAAVGGYAAAPLYAGAVAPTVVGLLIFLWTLLPSLLAELRNPHPARNEVRSAAEAYESWLNQGRWSVWVAASAVFIGFGLFLHVALLLWLTPPGWLSSSGFEWLVKPDEAIWSVVKVLCGAISISAMGLIGLATRVNKTFTQAKPVVKTALDVDHYLREHPRGDNPRTHITARYLALLRYLASAPDGRRYDSLVIVAHSQGTVITADLLRFLTHERKAFIDNGQAHEGKKDPLVELGVGAFGREPGKIPIAFFTCGSPLRQLYSALFPHLYRWVEEGPDPDALLGVCRWVNAYRTGDYVGRRVGPEDAKTPTKWTGCDISLGAGAHTHYLDGTSDRVGPIIDALITGQPV